MTVDELREEVLGLVERQVIPRIKELGYIVTELDGSCPPLKGDETGKGFEVDFPNEYRAVRIEVKSYGY